MTKSSDLRVISGKYRGRALRSPGSELTHPMGAREKLALFNMVNVEDAKVLDAYAGSGALGIEALSRGAAEVVFVEASPRICRVIRENLESVGADSLVFSEKLGKFTEREEHRDYFQVIFADPPYDKVDLAELNELAKLLSTDSVLALSSPKELGEIELDGLRLSSAHTYARARIGIYRKK